MPLKNNFQHSKFSSRQGFYQSRSSSSDNNFSSAGRELRTSIKIRQHEKLAQKDIIGNNRINHQQRDGLEKEFLKKDEIKDFRQGIKKILKSDLRSKIKDQALLKRFSAGYGVSKDDYLKVKSILNNNLEKNPEILNFSERKKIKRTLSKINQKNLNQSIEKWNTKIQSKLEDKISEITTASERVGKTLAEVEKIRAKRYSVNSDQDFSKSKLRNESNSKNDVDVENLRKQAEDLAI